MNASDPPIFWTAVECLAFYRRSDAILQQDFLCGDFDRQVIAVSRFCNAYKIHRNFAGSFDTNPNKYDAVIEELNNFQVTDYSSIAERVVCFENRIWKRYKPAGEKAPGDQSPAWHRKLSAASKLLWLKQHDSSIIIDGLAATALDVKGHSKPIQYGRYVDEWMRWYDKARPGIVSICEDLPEPRELPGITSQEWFYRRVWDWHLILPDYTNPNSTSIAAPPLP